MSKKALVYSHGFLGDILFTLPAVIALSKRYDEVTFIIGFPQPFHLCVETLRAVKNVKVEIANKIGPKPRLYYNKEDYPGVEDIYEMPECNRIETPIIQYQRACNIPDNEMLPLVISVPNLNQITMKDYISRLVKATNTVILGYPMNWEQCTIRLGDISYMSIDINQEPLRSQILQHQIPVELRRNVNQILQRIIEKSSRPILLVPLGLPYEMNQFQQGFNSTSLYTDTAALIKCCDLVIGQEGGLTNLAAGVNTPTLITTDFMYALYGSNGIMQRLDNPQLGPRSFTRSKPLTTVEKPSFFVEHEEFDPYITDDELVTQAVVRIEKL